MLNFLKERHKHNFEDVIWYVYCQDNNYKLYVYRGKCCSCRKVKEKRIIYQGNFYIFNDCQRKIDWWKSHGAITAEEFALKYG